MAELCGGSRTGQGVKHCRGMDTQGGMAGTAEFYTSREGLLPSTQPRMGSTAARGVLPICSPVMPGPAWLPDGGVTDEADGGMQAGKCRRGAWGRMLMGQMGGADGGMQVGGM